MNNLELADKLQAAASNHCGDLCGMLWDAGAALRNLHTENMTLRCTEMALKDINAELVEALKPFVSIYGTDDVRGWMNVRDQARAALEKAEGGEL